MPRWIVLLALSFSANLMALAPKSSSPSPGFYRHMVGDIEVTALSDGVFDMEPEKLLTNTTAEKVKKALASHLRKSPLSASVNGFLVNNGEKLILIDTGAGSFFGPKTGGLVKSLREAGYKPESVDEVYITHLHLDHIGGLVEDGKLVFPNAIVRADKHDVDHWLNAEIVAKAPKDFKNFYDGAVATFKPLQDANKLKPFEGDTELAKGVKAISNHGHTPGHTIYAIESKGQKLVVLGDILHVAAVQFETPGTTIAFDSDPKAASAQRAKVFADAAKASYEVAFSHVSFPGIGQLRAQNKGYQWVPVDYVVAASSRP